jgi:hypothetical protein
LASLTAASLTEAQGRRPAPERCEPAPASTPSASVWLTRSKQALGMDTVRSVLRLRVTDVTHEIYQSDRSYPPFAITTVTQDLWFDPASGVESGDARTAPGARVAWTARSGWLLRGSTAVPNVDEFAFARPGRELNPWAVLADWSGTGDARLAGRCWYRDYWRIVLVRPGRLGEERLFLDPVSAFPIKVDRYEPHYLWGDILAEYLYTTWFSPGFPLTATRLIDGLPQIQRSYGATDLVPRDSAPALRVPDDSDLRDSVALFLRPLPPDTVRVAPNIFVLHNRGYNETVALIQDTVFVLDATQGEARARQDSVWIGKLFPGQHPIVVLVSDLAWPHIAGLRYWVASGALVVSHRISAPFLERVLDRRWLRTPDLYERRRGRFPLRFRSVGDSLRLAGGRLTLYPLDGLGSEGGVVAWLPEARYLWASDYIQQLGGPSLYTSEVVRTVREVGIAPERFAAQHVKLSLWSAAARWVAVDGT